MSNDNAGDEGDGGTALPSAMEVYRATERAIGGPLERGADTDSFAAVLAQLSQVRTLVRRSGAGAADIVWDVTSRALHLINLPAASDLTDVRNMLLRIEREVRDLRRAIDGANSSRSHHVNRPD